MWAGRGKARARPAREAAAKAGSSNVRLFGFEFERKVSGVGTLATLAAGAVAVVAFLRGPEVTVLPPEQVMLLHYRQHANAKESFVRIFARMTVANDGPKDYPSIVTSESVRFRMPEQLKKCDGGYEQYWQELASIRPLQKGIDKPSDDRTWGKWLNHLSYKDEREPLPYVVSPGPLVAHHTFFAGRTPQKDEAGKKQCSGFLEWDDFMGQLGSALQCPADGTAGKELLIDFTFTVHTAADGDATASCKALLHCNHYRNLRDREYVSPACFSTNQTSTNWTQRATAQVRRSFRSLGF